jgi:hypothetical protein
MMDESFHDLRPARCVMLERKTGHPGRRGRMFLRAAPIALAAAFAPAPSQADWIPSVLDARCNPEDVDAISRSVREAIEASVRRAEASILAPTPVGDLACLNDLLMQPLDFFSNIGNLLGDLRAGLGALADISLDIDVAGMICRLAAEKWAELTRPLSEIEATIANFARAPADSILRLASGSLSSGGSSGMFPGVSGMANISGGESISSYVIPDTTVSPETSSIPIFKTPSGRDALDYSPSVIALYEQQLRAYDEALSVNLSEYLACRVSKNLDGSRITGRNSGRWDDHTDERWSSPSNLNCPDPRNGLPPYPTLPVLSASSASGVSISPASTSAPPEPTGERPFGQTSPSPSAAPETLTTSPATPSSIWEMIGQPTRTTP